jgi:hypothetical protein
VLRQARQLPSMRQIALPDLVPAAVLRAALEHTDPAVQTDAFVVVCMCVAFFFLAF